MFITFAKAAWDLMWDYTDLMPGEVGVFGYVEVFDKEFYVEEIFLVPQESSAAQVDFIDKGLQYAIEKAIADDKLDKLRLCAHSHGHASANWSSTDEDAFRKLNATGVPWFVNVIFNKEGRTLGRLDVYECPPMGRLDRQIKIDKIPVGWDRDREYENRLLTDLEHFVKDPPPPVTDTKKVGAGSSAAKGLPAPKASDAKGHLTQQAIKALDDHAIRKDDGWADSVSFADLEDIAMACGWESVDDSNNVRWYFDGDGEVQAGAMIPSDYDPEAALDRLGVGAYS